MDQNISTKFGRINSWLCHLISVVFLLTGCAEDADQSDPRIGPEFVDFSKLGSRWSLEHRKALAEAFATSDAEFPSAIVRLSPEDKGTLLYIQLGFDFDGVEPVDPLIVGFEQEGGVETITFDRERIEQPEFVDQIKGYFSRCKLVDELPMLVLKIADGTPIDRLRTIAAGLPATGFDASTVTVILPIYQFKKDKEEVVRQEAVRRKAALMQQWKELETSWNETQSKVKTEEIKEWEDYLKFEIETFDHLFAKVSGENLRDSYEALGLSFWNVFKEEMAKRLLAAAVEQDDAVVIQSVLENYPLTAVGRHSLVYYLATTKKGIYFPLLRSAYRNTTNKQVKEHFAYLPESIIGKSEQTIDAQYEAAIDFVRENWNSLDPKKSHFRHRFPRRY